MYKRLLILKYLRRKLAPLFAALAVTLCTAMVIIVISVMGGFLDMLRDSAKSVTGDLVVEAAYGLRGFSHYEGLVEALEAMEDVEVATPAIQAMGLINFREGPLPVIVQGVEFEKLDRIIGLGERTMWTREQIEERTARNADYGFYSRQGLENGAEVMRAPYPVGPSGEEVRNEGEEAGDGDGDVGGVATAWLGIEVFPGNFRNDAGGYDFVNSPVGYDFTLTVVPINRSGTAGSYTPSRKTFLVGNEFKSGLFDVDRQTVLVPLGVLQDMLEMGPVEEFVGADPITLEGGRLEMTEPGRVNQVIIKVTDDVSATRDLQEVRTEVEKQVRAYFERVDGGLPPYVVTWEEVHGQLIGAVKNEKGLITFLFVVISAVAVVMVATTFYMTVLEKTRDIGTLRAIGASRVGIAALFLGYGLAIGLVGAAAGTGFAALVVLYLNEIQAFLASYLGVTGKLAIALLGGALGGAIVGVAVGFVRRRLLLWTSRLAIVGAAALFVPALLQILLQDGHAAMLNTKYSFQMWDPQTYFFDEIPARLSGVEVVWIAAGAVVSSVLGAVIPALVASAQDPVEALRYE